jgi:OOP family OmpA-OmpF porin
MRSRRPTLAAAACAAATLLGAPAPAQEAGPRRSAEEIAAILRPAARPAPAGMPRTRGITPGGGEPAAGPAPAPGAVGSGVLPDLEVMFRYGSAELTPQARGQLDELARALGLEEMRPYRFLIAGHTDAVGGEASNDELSRRRAEAVAGYLAREHGIAPGRLAAEGRGEREPADPADPTSGRNRRVEVRTLE